MSKRVRTKPKRYWPVIMWLYDVTDQGRLKYKMSAAHVAHIKACRSWEQAKLAGLKVLHAEGGPSNIQRQPTFIVSVYHQVDQPPPEEWANYRMITTPINLKNYRGEE